MGVSLGDDFLAARFDNPTGYWEDKGVVALNERVLAALGLRWEDVSLIERSQFKQPQVLELQRETVAYLRRSLATQPLWGFKDPRSIRLLPFWRGALRDCEADDAYVLAVRNPLSVAASLFARQAMDADTSHQLWLVYLVPFLREVAGRPFVVVDYDSLMQEPRRQLERIAYQLSLPMDATNSTETDRFIADFLDSELRHSIFSRHDFDKETSAATVTREAYLWLNELATDRLEPQSPRFWEAWESIENALPEVIRMDATRP